MGFLKGSACTALTPTNDSPGLEPMVATNPNVSLKTLHESLQITREKGQVLTVKVSLGLTSLYHNLCSEFLKTEILRGVEDREKQTTGVPSPCVTVQLGYVSL